jgi:hypothetical protein
MFIIEDVENPGHAKPNAEESDGSAITAALPLAPPSVASVSRAVEGEDLVADDLVCDLLDRITQQIFQAGLILQAALDDGRSIRDIQLAIDQLDSALVDVRSTVFTGTFHLTRGPAVQPTRAVPAAIAHLSIAAEFLDRVVDADLSRSDGDRWFAATYAEQSVYAAILALLDN